MSHLRALLCVAGLAFGFPPGTVLRAQAPEDGFRPRALSPFAAAKARALIHERLPCLGCHRLDGDGGRIGPDLSRLPPGTAPAFVYAMIRDPQGTLPGSTMPKTPMPPEALLLVVNYLVGRGASGAGSGEAGGGAAPTQPVASPRPTPGQRDARALYATYCAACHGPTGKGDGYNASFLPVPPAVHADRRAMSERSDAMLFDAIYAGGYVLNRSNRMPGFGRTLGAADIRALVGYIRELCRCRGPAWSRDDAAGR